MITTELSINTLVVIILGIFILGAGFLFLSKIIDTNKDLLKAVDQNTQTKIKNMLAKGELVAIPNNVRNARINEPEYFGIGVKNTLLTDTKFKIEINLNKAINSNGNEILPTPTITTFMNNEEFTLAPNGIKTDNPVSITIPKGSSKGTYIFEVEVKYEDSTTSGTWITYKLKQIRITI